MASPDPVRLAILTELREAAGLTQSDMAQRCGLNGKQARLTAGAWEMGRMTPSSRRRIHFSGYLWDALGLRDDPPRFAEIWEMLCEEWGWDPLTDQEWHRLTKQSRPTPATSAPEADNTTTTPLTPPPSPFQAPSAPHHFVGRADLLEQLTDELTTTDGARLVALVGMGGIGKTTLATQIAHTLRTHFPDGVLWAQTAISTPLDILQSWARAFGYDYSELRDVESCAAALRSVVAPRRLLYVLDNVESVQRVRPLLIGGEQSAILLTTRSEDAAVALGAQGHLLGELSSAESTELLITLLGKERVEKEAEAAAQIGDLLHHLPLAVEIVGQLLAARSRRPLAQMAQRLHDVGYRLDLQISDRDVRTSFLVSWEALDEAHQRVFAHLAVFAGRSFTVQALAALLGEDEDRVWDQLDLLVARSLVKEAGDDRYSQHPLLADFAREQLGDAPAVWARFAESQLAFAREHQEAYIALEPEWDNVMAGMEAAHRLEAWEMVVAYAEVLGDAWLRGAKYVEARQGYEWAVEGAKIRKDVAASVYCQVQLGFILCELSNFAEAKLLLQDAKGVATQVRWGHLQADAEYHLARIALEQGEYEECDTLLSNCESMREERKDSVGIAKTLYLRSILARRMGNYALAQRLGERALRIQEAENDIPGMLGTLYILTDCALSTKDYHLSEQYCKQSLQILKKNPRKAELAEVYFSLAMTHRYQEAPAQAWTYIERSRELALHMGSRAFLSYILYEQSRIKFQMGDMEQALEIGLNSFALMSELEDNFNLVICLRYLGDLYQHLQENDKAVELWEQGEQIAIDLRHPEIHLLQERLGSSLT